MSQSLKSLSSIFERKLFRIPDFQRGYSWGEKQLNDFWDDLSNLKDDKIHYAGLLTVEKINPEEINSDRWHEDKWLFERDYEAYYLIDGQQRLTTSIILLSEILNNFKEDDIFFESKESIIERYLYVQYKDSFKSFIFGYEKDNPSDEYFKSKILDQYSSSSDKFPETLYTANLLFARNFFINKISNITQEDIKNLFKKLTTRFVFNFYEIDKQLDVYVTFETMNNRGKPLSNLELLKNRLVYISTLLDIDGNQLMSLRKDINESWKTIYEYLGKNKEKPLDDDEFLKNHWIMYFKYDRKQSESYANYLLREKFTTANVFSKSVDFNYIKNYINSLSLSIKNWFYLHNPERSSCFSFELKEWILKLNRLGMRYFSPLLMAVLYRSKNDLITIDIVKNIERFIFLIFNLSQYQSNMKNSHFYKMANDIYTGKVNLDKISKDLIFWIDDKKQGKFSLLGFRSHIENLYKHNDGFYKWNGIKYFLFEYELNLQLRANGDSKVTWEDLDKRKKDESIEHIYPQNPTDNYWLEKFKPHSDKNNILLHNLGNLLLLSQSKNSELKNKPFDFKKKHKNKEGNYVGFFNGSYSEIEVSSYLDWGPDEIKQRGIKMLDFLSERWGVDFSKYNIEKEQLLGFDDKLG